MTTQEYSAIVRLWRDAQTGQNRLQVIRSDTAREISLSEGTFLVRVFIDETASIERCYLRHIASGLETYIQSGGGLQAFFQACLLQTDSTDQGNPVE